MNHLRKSGRERSFFLPVLSVLEVSSLNKVINAINFTMKHVLNIIMAVLTIAVFAQVIFRFFLESPLAWTEELAIYCLVWLTFLGAAYAMSLKAHIGVSFLTDLFPLRIRQIIYVIATLAGLAFYLLLVIQGYALMNQSMQQLSPVLGIPMGFVYAVIPISGLFLMMNVIVLFMKDFKTGGQSA